VNIHSFLPMLAAVVFLLVAFFVYSKGTPNKVNKIFSVMLLCISLWNIEVAGIISAPNARFAEIWADIFRNGLLFIPPTFLHFALLFTLPKGIPIKFKKILLYFYITSCFFAVINWTPYFTSGVKEYPWGYHIQSGPLYPLFVLQAIAGFVLSFYLLIRGFIYAESYQRQKVKYFFIAISISFIVGSLNFLPMFGFQVYPFMPIAIIIGLFFAAYSVVQNRLMNVSIFMAKGLGYLISLAILAIPAAFIIIFLETLFFKKTHLSFTLILILIGSACAIYFNKIKEKVDKAMHQIIVKDKYFYHQILEEFSRRLVTIVELNRLLHMLAETVERSMGVKHISIFLFNSEKEIFNPALVQDSRDATISNITFKIDNPWVKWLKEKKEAILRAELENLPKSRERDELLKVMGELQVEVCLPLIYTDRLIGFINLGHKSEEEMYYREDLNLLNTLANQVAIAIENATLYENLKKSQNILRRSDRLASLGTLIASLAHEIRNPLVSIKTFTQLLPERLDDEEFRNYFIKIASGEIDRLTSLISELLGFAKPSEPNLKGEDVNAIIDKMIVLVSTEARKKNIALNKNFGPDLPLVMVDAEQIKQVLLNILLNAIQAVPGAGDIWIETRVVQIPHEEALKKYVQIEIRDSGIGIPKENIDHVFDPFFTTRQDGSGLGLAISHQIINEHGGFIDLESEVEKGTSFRIHLPLNIGGKGVAGK